MIPLACALLLAAAPPLAETDLPRFKLLATPAAAEPARALAGRLEAERDRLAARLGGDYPGPTEVRLGADADEAAALAAPDALALDAAELARTPTALRHALAHHALARLGGPGLPRWLDEGLAAELAGEGGPAQELALFRAGGVPLPLSALARTFPEGYAGAELAYAESASFAAHLEAAGGPAGLHRLLSATARGEPFDAAFAAAYGPRAEATWRDGLRLRYAWVPGVTASGTAFTAVALLAAALSARSRRRRREREAELALDAQAAEAAARIATAEAQALPAEPPAPPQAAGTKTTLH